MGPDVAKRRNKAPEADLQKTITTYLRLALPPSSGVARSSTLNGVRLATEAARGRAKAQGLNAGVVLDMVFIPLHGPRMGVAHWIEVKPKGSYPSDAQRVTLAALVPVGLGVICHNLGEVYEALTAWGFEPKARP